ncbi:MAG: hypothetical protein JWR37_4820, partial [Mycobacterium sp.]|nr:hypothetical protein [Mycobacterium sp.]
MRPTTSATTEPTENVGRVTGFTAQSRFVCRRVRDVAYGGVMTG